MCNTSLGKLQIQVNIQASTIQELQAQVQELQDTQWRLLRLLTDTRNEQGARVENNTNRVGG